MHLGPSYKSIKCSIANMLLLHILGAVESTEGQYKGGD